jgi:hypothetical protein
LSASGERQAAAELRANGGRLEDNLDRLTQLGPLPTTNQAED